MKKMSRLIFLYIVLCAGFYGLSGQTVTAIYHHSSQNLEIINNSDKLVGIFEEDEMPDDFRAAIQKSTSNGSIEDGKRGVKCINIEGENGNYRLIVPIDSNQMKGYDSIKVYLFKGDNVYFSPEKIGIVYNVPNEPEVAVAPATPFYKTRLFYIGAGAAVLLLLVFLLLAILGKKRIKEKIVVSNRVIQVVEEEKTEYTVGLAHVRQEESNYYVINMEDFFRDTAVKKIYVARDVIRALNTYFKAFLENPERTNETGCYLVGCWERTGAAECYNISLEAIVRPEDDAVYDEYSLNFGLKIGIKLGSVLRNLAEKTGRDYVHTSWMHSHPGLGLFLSSHDLIVQKQLAYSEDPKRMVAIVIDTNTPDWQMSVFTAKTNGEMNNKEDMLQTISFDILNEWCRHPSARPVATPALSLDNTFVVKSEDEKDWFSFSAKAINMIDDALFSDIPVSGCFLKGKIQDFDGKRVRIINTCETEGGEGESIGCLCLEKENASELGADNFKETLAKYDFCLFYRSDIQNLIIYKNEKNEMNLIQTSLKEMKEWTRRKRI